MRYTLTIQADGAAFDDDWDGLAEVSRILRATAQRLANEPPPLTRATVASKEHARLTVDGASTFIA